MAHTEGDWIRHWARKIRCIREAGKFCKSCGVNIEESPWLAAFHHRDPDTKEFEISRMFTRSSFSELIDEIEKCDLLCHNCHSSEHINMNSYIKLIKTAREKSNTIHEYTTGRKNIDKSKLINLYKEGMSDVKISKRLGITRSAVYYHRSKLNLKINNVRDKSIDIDKVQQLLSEGKTKSQIAARFNISRKTLYNKLKYIKTNQHTHT